MHNYPRLSQVLETVYIARGRPHEAFFTVVPCAEMLQSTAGVRLVFCILAHRIYDCLGKLPARYTGDTVSLRSCDVDACHSAPIVTLVTLYLLVWIRSKNYSDPVRFSGI